MQKRTWILLLEALGWVVAAVVVAFAVEQLTDYAVAAVVIPVAGVIALGTLVEIRFPGPLTGKRHPKAASDPVTEQRKQ